ncbi:MAG: HRDC domain-containing protein [Deltaproteobacteria bacterium]|nr:HRDC domain-containing protein [Deltaproteobacteria bacterium]
MPVFIRSTAELRHWVERLASCQVLAVDTEFHPERKYFPELMLVQLRGDEGEVLLIDPRGDVDLRLLSPLIESKVLLVHGGEQDVDLLARATGGRATRWFDTQVAAGFCGLGYPRRLGDLVLAVLGRAMDKGETLSDWSRRPLSAEQLRYAADDVLVLAPLATALRERVEAMGHAAGLEACLGERLAEAHAAPADELAWRRVPSAHLLDDRERAIVAALAAWREKSARFSDVPPHSIAPDHVLVDLARRRPQSAEAMRENRRMPSQVWKQHGATILGILAGADRLPVPLAPITGLAADALRLAARLAEVEGGVAAALVLQEREVDYILKGLQIAHWRLQALGAAFLDFTRERTAISVRGKWSPTIAIDDR